MPKTTPTHSNFMKLIGIEDSEFCHFCGFLSYIYEGGSPDSGQPLTLPRMCQRSRMVQRACQPAPFHRFRKLTRASRGGDGVARQHPDRLGMRGCSVLSRGDVEDCQMKQSRSTIPQHAPSISFTPGTLRLIWGLWQIPRTSGVCVA